MVRLEDNKFLTKYRQIENPPLPARVYIPLSQHSGKICQPLVNIGDCVLKGRKIAGVEAHIQAPIHSSVSGKVAAITEHAHPVLGRCKSIVIESDSLDKLEPASTRTTEDIDKLTPDNIRQIIFEAGIVGMGGAGFPTHLKLNPPKPVHTLIVNAMECEPYLTADYRLMIEKTNEILRGIALAARCLGVKSIYLAIEDNKLEAVKRFQAFHPQLKIKVLKSAYPQGGEKQLIKDILGKEVGRSKLPFDLGVVVHNVATMFAIYEAVYLGKPLYERLVTVSGNCVANPKNLLARIGTPIKELIDFCGGLKEKVFKIIIGGPMMGFAQYTDQVPVIKTTTAILLFGHKEARVFDEAPCVRCGACVRECPVGLMPCLINLASEKSLWDEVKAYAAPDCIECGLCNYVCPAKRLLVQSIKRAKLECFK